MPRTRAQYAIRALRNGKTRAIAHRGHGDLRAAVIALLAAVNTAEKWLTATHPSDGVTLEARRAAGSWPTKIIKKAS